MMYQLTLQYVTHYRCNFVQLFVEFLFFDVQEFYFLVDAEVDGG